MKAFAFLLCLSLRAQVLMPIQGPSGLQLPPGLSWGTDFHTTDPLFGERLYNIGTAATTVNYGLANATSGENVNLPSASTFGASYSLYSFFQPPNGTLNFSGTDLTIGVSYKFAASTSSIISLVSAYNLSSSFQGWGVQLNGSGANAHKLCFWNGSAWVCGNTSVDDGAWHTSIITVSSSTASFYLDGSADGTPSSGHTSSWAGLTSIGGQYNGISLINKFQVGLNMSGLYIWSRILTSGERTTLQSILSASPRAARPTYPSRLSFPPSLVSSWTNNHVLDVPPMGYNTWNYCALICTEAEIKAQADAMVSTGLLGAGYKYFTPSELGQTRDASTAVLHANATAIPDDYGPLFAYISGDGLIPGFYGSPGWTTCSNNGRGDSRHEYQDSALFSAWSVGYVFYDMCSFPLTNGLDYGDTVPTYYTGNQLLNLAYQTMAQAMRANLPNAYLGVFPYFLSTDYPYTELQTSLVWCEKMYGVTCFTRPLSGADVHTWSDFLWDLAYQIGIGGHATVGHYHNPDFLLVGNSGISDAEGIAQISLWSVLSAPLDVSVDLTGLSTNNKATLKNLDVIAVDQDSLGWTGDLIQATAVGSSSTSVMTAIINSLSLTVNSGTTPTVGQLLTGLGIAANTYVQSVSGSTVYITRATTGALSSTTITASWTSQIWAKQMSGADTCAAALLNTDPGGAHDITLTVSTLTTAIPGCTGPWTASTNIWGAWPTCNGTNHCAAALGAGTISTTYTATSVAASSAIMIKLIP